MTLRGTAEGVQWVLVIDEKFITRFWGVSEASAQRLTQNTRVGR